jgi:hypothetical protein
MGAGGAPVMQGVNSDAAYMEHLLHLPCVLPTEYRWGSAAYYGLQVADVGASKDHPWCCKVVPPPDVIEFNFLHNFIDFNFFYKF